MKFFDLDHQVQEFLRLRSERPELDRAIREAQRPETLEVMKAIGQITDQIPEHQRLAWQQFQETLDTQPELRAFLRRGLDEPLPDTIFAGGEVADLCQSLGWPSAIWELRDLATLYSPLSRILQEFSSPDFQPPEFDSLLQDADLHSTWERLTSPLGWQAWEAVAELVGIEATIDISQVLAPGRIPTEAQFRELLQVSNKILEELETSRKRPTSQALVLTAVQVVLAILLFVHSLLDSDRKHGELQEEHREIKGLIEQQHIASDQERRERQQEYKEIKRLIDKHHQPARSIYVVTEPAAVYSQPSKTSTARDKLSPGQVVVPLKPHEGWQFIRYLNDGRDQVGWLQQDKLVEIKIEPNAENDDDG